MILDKDGKIKIPDNVRHSDDIYFKRGKLYKIFADFGAFLKEKERNIDFLIKNRVPNTPKIYKKIKAKRRFVGYIMEYISSALTFRQGIYCDIDYEKKESAIRDVYSTLKYLHGHNLFIGDIHSDNFLITKDGDGYIIDLEELRGIGDEFKFKALYLIKTNNNSNKINISDRYTDNVKLMITSLSLLYKIDLEKYISNTDHSINLEELYYNIIINFHDDKLDEYFKLLIAKEEVGYFDDFYFNKELDINKKRA